MASRFRIEWTEAASSDLEDIIRFIARDSPLNAAKLYKRLRTRAQTLRNLPARGRVVPELANLEITAYLELSVPPYRLIYRIEKPRVFVHAVLDARRDLRELLAERLLRSR
ncbi:MAG: plasmid stabilization protein [Acidobacteria bacterium]|nr:MAG: plasmid stabilization protein [Acidobacteriota bacterium]